ncbi:MAG: efflux RND transporter periplasmic adaptor subunit [Verrucomicrobiota bacterium]|nr:efflux RND transporter periplasmic adaptor subunit [Verrucomicrobiota bacterium]
MRNTILKALAFILCMAVLAVAEYFALRAEKQQSELVLYGNVDVRLVDIGFRIPGQVSQLFFEEGDAVKTGQLLALLDKTPYDAQLREAEANVKAVEATLNNAKILLNRRKDLIGVGGVSQEDVDNGQANYDQLYANWLYAKNAMQVQQDNLSYTAVCAPTDGVILTRVREPGTVVNPSDPVYTLSVASPVWIRAFAEEPDLGKISYGMKAEIYTDTKGSPVYQGYVGFISPMAEFTPKTVETTELRTDLVYRLRIYAENPDWRLKQGMPVTVKLKLHD